MCCETFKRQTKMDMSVNTISDLFNLFQYTVQQLNILKQMME